MRIHLFERFYFREMESGKRGIYMRFSRSRKSPASIAVATAVLLLASLTLFFTTTPALADETTRWCSQEPFPTGNDLFAMDYAGSDTLWAVGGEAGSKSTILKSTDAGENWYIQYSSANVELRGVDAVNTSIVWAVGENGTIVKTTDGGVTWQVQVSPTANLLMDVSAVSSTTAWAVGWGGTIIKTANGTDWGPVTTPVPGEWLMGVSAYDSTHAWATTSNGRIIATANGTDWVIKLDHSAGQETLNAVSAVNENVVYVAGQRWGDNLASIYRTANGGTSWDLVTPAPSTRNLYGIYALDETHAWAVGGYSTILATTNGTTWTAQTSPSIYTLLGVCASSSSDAWVAGERGALVKTTDGATWNNMGFALDYQTCGVDASDADNAYVTCTNGPAYRGRVYRTTDAGASWELVYDIAQQLYGVSSPSPEVVWVTGLHGAVFRSTDGGDTWEQRSNGLADAWYRSISALDADTAWVVAGNTVPRIAKTIDGGQTWSSQTSPTVQPLYGVSAVNANIALAVGTNGAIIKTVNGTNWSLQTCPVNAQYLNSVSAVDASTAWAVGYDETSGIEKGVIIKTENGTSWGEQDSHTTSVIGGVSAVDADTAFAVGWQLLKTTDGGDNWGAEAAPVFFNTGWSGIAAPAGDAAWAVGDYSILHTHVVVSAAPSSAPPGSLVTLTGGGFGSNRADGSVTFGSTAAGGFGSWSDTTITAYVPDGLTPGQQQVRVHNRWGQTMPVDFTVEALAAPHIDTVSPGSGGIGGTVTLTGTDFGMPSDLSAPAVSFGSIDVPAHDALSWSRTQIQVAVPAGVSPGALQVQVQTNGGVSNTKDFDVLAAPTMSSMSPTSGATGTTITINGGNFRSPQGAGCVYVGNHKCTGYTSWSNTQIKVNVPSAASTVEAVKVVTTGGNSNTKNFKVTPHISAYSPTSGKPGQIVTIAGTGFSYHQGSSYCYFGSRKTTACSSWTNTKFKVKVPSGVSGAVKLKVVIINGGSSNSVNFTVR